MKLAISLAFLAAFAIAQETATVEGVVVNKVTGAGIGGVTLWFWSSGTNSFKAITDDAGTFHLSGLTEGDYSSSVQKTGYSNPAVNEIDPLADPPKRHVSPGAEPARYRFELIPPAVLRGRVIGPDGNPASASVELDPRRSVKTNADGSFAFENLTPGDYMMLARPIITGRAAERSSEKDDIRAEVVPTYYPSAVDRSLAQSIAVHPGAELDGYEIQLQSAEVHRVRGIVLDPDGKPAAKARVELHAKLPDFTGGLTINGSAGKGLTFSFRKGPAGGQADEPPFTTAEDGVFEFPSVRMGEWTAQATSDWIRDEIHQRNFLRFGNAAFRVEHRDPDELTIQFVTPVQLSIPVTFVLSDGSLPAPGVSVSVTLMSDTASAMIRAPIDPDGVLRFGETLPGTSRIQADVESGNYYVDSILLGSTDITGQSVELTPASPPLKIVLKPGGTVRGTLEEGDNATVVLFPPNFTGIGYSVRGDGKAFEITGIPPGEYSAIALDKFEPAAMTDPSRLRDLMRSGATVRVEQGSATSVQLKVNHVPD